MKKVVEWSKYYKDGQYGEYRECSETFKIGGRNNICKLSVTKEARHNSSDGIYLLVCDAICDIEIENDDISELSMMIGTTSIKSKKINGKWDIQKWFTFQKPLITMAMSWSTEYLFFITKNKDINIKIRWKQIRYEPTKRRFLARKEQAIKHYSFILWYAGGFCGVYDLNIQLDKNLVKIYNEIQFKET